MFSDLLISNWGERVCVPTGKPQVQHRVEVGICPCSSLGPSSSVALEISAGEVKGAGLADCLLLCK